MFVCESITKGKELGKIDAYCIYIFEGSQSRGDANHFEKLQISSAHVSSHLLSSLVVSGTRRSIYNPVKLSRRLEKLQYERLADKRYM